VLSFSPAMNLTQIQPSLETVTAPAPPAPAARFSVSLGALGDNYRTLVRRAAPAAVAPVVKANAYGIGLEPVVKTLAAQGADMFFVARLEEGFALRALLPRVRIFVLDGLRAGAAAAHDSYRLTPVLNTLEEIAEWGAHAREKRVTLDAALHVDTGMNRSGLTHDEAALLADEARRRLSGIRVALIMSHLASADEPGSKKNRVQLERFLAALDRLPPAPASLAATAGIDLGREYLFDIVRPGLGLYGGNPQPGRANPYARVVSLTARALQLRDVAKGDTVGYGGGFTAHRPTVLAVVPLGYADGLHRAMGVHGYAAAGGMRVPFAGRISMDLVMLDVTDVPASERVPGMEIEFLGDTISLEDAAFAGGTINHEILTSLSPRATRVYLED
jgi:alanine racemase